MTDESLTDALLREFLLGKVDEEERNRIESLFLTDSQTHDRVLAAEQDLIEDYLENSLTASDRKRFLSVYGQTPAQQRQLRISKSIRDWALREAGSTQTGVPANSLWTRLREWLRLEPRFVVPVVVTVVIAILVAAVWLNSRRAERNRHLAIEQELAQLNGPSKLLEVPPHMISQDLSPGAARSVERETELNKSAGTEIVELHLSWTQKERYSAYQAEIHRVGEAESFTISNLPAENQNGYRIRLRLPASFLRRGHYLIRLSGIGSDGSIGSSEEYTFAVSD